MNWRDAVGAAVLALGMTAGHAADWPEKPLRMVVPVGPGSQNDLAARTMADRLGTIWGQRVVVENFVGAGGTRGVKELVAAKPDGYSLGFLPASTILVAPIINKDTGFNPERDVQPIAPVFESPLVFAASSQSGINSIADLIRAAKAQPGKIGISTLQVNSAVHLAAVMLKAQAGIDLLVVPFNQPNESLLSVLRGDTPLTISGVGGALSENVKAGKLKFIGTTSKRRMPGLEDVPTAGETVPGYSASSWGALFAPAGTAPALVERMSKDAQTVLGNADVVKLFAANGMYPIAGSSADLAAMVKADRPAWEKVAREAIRTTP